MDFTDIELARCYRFAQQMKGNHNRDMIMEREDWEIFRDDFRGKLGEVALRKYILNNIPNAQITGDIDYEVTPLGQWDITDLLVNAKYINVKSVKQRSNFLMIETKRYKEDGHYSYLNNDGDNVKIDAYVLVRVTVEPDMNIRTMGYKEVTELKRKHQVSAEILGGITHDDFWKRKHLAEKGIRCTYHNLKAICDGCKTELPDRVIGSEKKTEILQQGNYIMYKSELGNVESII